MTIDISLAHEEQRFPGRISACAVRRILRYVSAREMRYIAIDLPRIILATDIYATLVIFKPVYYSTNPWSVELQVLQCDEHDERD